MECLATEEILNNEVAPYTKTTEPSSLQKSLYTPFVGDSTEVDDVPHASVAGPPTAAHDDLEPFEEVAFHVHLTKDSKELDNGVAPNADEAITPQIPLLSLVPDYDLTPSPPCSPLSLCSPSPMLRLSDSEPDSPELSPNRSMAPLLKTPSRDSLKPARVSSLAPTTDSSQGLFLIAPNSLNGLLTPATATGYSLAPATAESSRASFILGPYSLKDSVTPAPASFS